MKSKITMILFVLVLGSVLTTALVSVDFYTAPRIAKNKEIKLRISILKSLGIDYSEEKIDETFEENVVPKTTGEAEFYVSTNGGNVAFEFYGSGLWGPIHGTIALESDLSKIKGITIIHQEETPGLGGRIADADFLEKFVGKTVSEGLIIQPPGKATMENEVDGITGATLSCMAFEAILNSEIQRYVSIVKEDK